ncbi:hypothetical protein HYT23_02145 [Candidatus Pacearchaeota archaeon]|nr:hypothetical protein [Candidatus Pacearchaeota archaeon]
MAQAKKKQKFFDVEIPLIGKTAQLFAYTLEETHGRNIVYDLTRLLRGKNAILTTKVEVNGDKAIAVPKEFRILPYFMKKMIRKGTNYVEDSFSTPCKDAVLTIKPFLITRRKVSRAVRKALRIKAKEVLIEYVKNKTANELFDELVQNKLQRPLSLKLKKIYPLSLCEIRVFSVAKSLDKKQEKVENPKAVVEKTEEVKEEKSKKKVKKKEEKEEDEEK